MFRRIAAITAAVVLSTVAVASAHEGHTHKMMGTVKAVHADTKHVDIALRDGSASGFDYTDTTKFVKGTKDGTVADLKEGVRVVVEGQMDHDNKMTATRVELGTTASSPAPAEHQH